jgi:probable phosphoglycerate mutase
VTTTIFFVRHGSHDRLNHVLCGRMPGVYLSERGRDEVLAVGGRLSSERLSAVYSSPLERTQETAELIAEASGLPVETSEDLLEVDFGAWTGVTFEDLRADPRWPDWSKDRGAARTPDGESLPEVQARLRRFVEAAIVRHPDQRIAAVSHGDPIKTILAAAIGMPLANIDRLEISPASISVLVAGAWGMRVFSVNEAAR